MFFRSCRHFVASNWTSDAFVDNVRLSNNISPDIVITGSEYAMNRTVAKSVVKSIYIDFRRFGCSDEACSRDKLRRWQSKSGASWKL